MANSIMNIDPSKLPSFLAGAAINNDLTAHASTTFPVISIKGKVFTIVRDGDRKVIPNPKDPESPSHFIDVVLVKASPNTAKAYYDTEFRDGEDSKPRCFSNDGKYPDASIAQPCCKSCAACPFNRFGSARQGKGKACSDSIRIAVAPAGMLDDPLMIKVPATSMKALGEYGRTLARYKIPYQAAITRISFDTATPTPKLVFSLQGYVDEGTYRQAMEESETEIVKAIIGEPSEIRQAEAQPVPAPAPVTAAPAKPQVTTEEVTSIVDELISKPASVATVTTEEVVAAVEDSKKDDLASAFANLTGFDD